MSSRPVPSQRSGRGPGVGVALLLVLGGLSGAAQARPALPESDLDNPIPVLLGAYVHKREVGSIDVLVEAEGYLVPLESFVEIADCRLTEVDGSQRLSTPLGEVVLDDGDLRETGGVVYIRQRAIEEKFATTVTFDSSQFALDFNPPWRTGLGWDAATTQPDPIPDVGPPKLSLSTLQSDLRHNRSDDSETYSSSTTFSGRMAGGYWRLRYQDDLADSRTVRDYAWFRAIDNKLLLAGHQNVRMHPLLQGVEFTGFQLAATNQALDRFSRTAEPGVLLPRNLQPVTAFVGTGPPAGLAELWVEGRLVERQVIGLDGAYDFQDVSLQARRASRIEVRVYERLNLQLPVAIYEENRNASEFLLEQGAYVQLGGLGQTGNLLRNQTESLADPGIAGFFQARYGVSDRLTIEGAVQHIDGLSQAFGGIVSRLRKRTVYSAGLAASNGALGYRLDLDGQYGFLRLVGRSQMTEQGFRPTHLTSHHDHLVEVGYGRSGRWDVALIGKSWRNNTENVDYLLPAVAWRPVAPLAFRARPDQFGDYRFDMTYALAQRTRLSASTINDQGYVNLSHRFGRQYQLAVGSEFGDGVERQSAIATWHGQAAWRPGWTAGLLRTQGEPGYLIGGSVQLVPGILAQVQYETDTFVRTVDGDVPGPRLYVNVSADLGFSRGRIHAARTVSVRDDRGGIAGVVRIDAPEEFSRPSLAGQSILLNGRQAARTAGDGSFFIGGLKPGIYAIQLETESLPIELSIVTGRRIAEVAPAAVTRADFVVRPEFGIAGRVHDTRQRPLPEVSIELYDGEGNQVRTTRTDRFGLYRIDGLPIGFYRLQVAAEEILDPLQPLPERLIRIHDDFLFGQDLVLPYRPVEPEDDAVPMLPMDVSRVIRTISTGGGPPHCSATRTRVAPDTMEKSIVTGFQTRTG